MEIGGEFTFEAPQEIVWRALQDPNVLASVMPGGEDFEEVAENEYSGILNIRVGPVQGKFSGDIKLSDIIEPSSYKMSVDGKGAPGFVKASGHMQLNGDGETTLMTYEGTAQIGGRIASVGQRLLEASTKSIIRQSLEGLNEYLKIEAARSSDEAVSSEEADINALAQGPTIDFRPPSQSSVAMNVAKDVAGDFMRPKNLLLALIITAIAVIIILILT